jgi:hypothetical protein
MTVPSHKSYLKTLSSAIDLYWEGEKTSAVHVFKKAELELDRLLGKAKAEEYLASLESLPKKWRDCLLSLIPTNKKVQTSEYFSELKPRDDSFQTSESEILLPDELLPEEEVQIILSLYKEDKLLEAFDLLVSLQEKYQRDFEDNEKIKELKSDYQDIHEIFDSVDDKNNWIEASTGDVRVLYKKIENSKCYSLITEGIIKAPLFNFISIIYETDLYHTWLPYCQRSSTIANLSKTRKIIFQEYDLPLLSTRHACLYAYGANLLQSKGAIVIVSKSCDQDKQFKGFDLPQDLSSKKAIVNIMGYIVKPLTANEIHVTFICNFDPVLKAFTYKILNYFAKKFSRGIFRKLAKLAQNFEGSRYEELLKAPENREFFDYLNQSLEEYLNSVKSMEV